MSQFATAPQFASIATVPQFASIATVPQFKTIISKNIIMPQIAITNLKKVPTSQVAIVVPQIGNVLIRPKKIHTPNVEIKTVENLHIILTQMTTELEMAEVQFNNAYFESKKAYKKFVIAKDKKIEIMVKLNKFKMDHDITL